MNLLFKCGRVGLIGLVFSLAAPSKAQDNWIRVTIVRVKPDMIARWRELNKSEIIPAYKKAGIRSFAVWRTVPFGNSYEFTLMMPMKSFAELDRETPLRRGMLAQGRRQVEAELDKCVSGAENLALLGLSDISSGKPNAPPPQLMIVQTVTVRPTDLSKYLNFLKEDMKPVVQKAGVELWEVYRHVFGSSTNQITTFRSLKNYAELDSGPLAARILSPEQANMLAAKDNQLVESSRIVIAQYDSELSYN
jgi:hypothetical protein